MIKFSEATQNINVKKISTDIFSVKSHSSEKEYLVNLKNGSCTCPHYIMRLVKSGGKCKHYNEVITYLQTISTDNKQLFNDIIMFIKSQPKNIGDWNILNDKFGEDTIQEMINLGMLYKYSNYQLGILE